MYQLQHALARKILWEAEIENPVALSSNFGLAQYSIQSGLI